MIEKINFKNTDWCKIQKAVYEYTWLMKNLQNQNKGFKKKFASFYKVNLGIKKEAAKKYFFNLLKDCLKENNYNYFNILGRL